jgi:hypothetical protein
VNDLLEYKLPKDGYVNFDALSLKEFIIEKLNENPRFTDQNYEGSNIAAFLDVIAYSYHVLLFYLNQTSSETLFSQSNLYENMNRIVELIGYKPTGKKTSLLSVDVVAESTLPIGSYKIPKYSYFLVDKIQYTTLENEIFEKTTPNKEKIESLSNNLVLYQGVVKEYPTYFAQGLDYESFPIVVDNVVDDKKFIASDTLSVYVKEQEYNKWFEYSSDKNLYLSENSDRVYDLRLNENGHFEIKFGNGIFGRKLKEGDEVVVFYILSDGVKGVVAPNSINNKKLFNFNNPKFLEIYNEVYSKNSIDIDLSNNSSLNFTNSQPSSDISDAENVDQIRNNVPILNNSNLRLISERDYDTYLIKTFPNILNSAKTVSNDQFIKEYLQYFYEICVDPNKTTRVILNNVNFSDSCDFNNVNIFTVPKFKISKDGSYPPYLSNSLKNSIVDNLAELKMLSHEIVPRDPIYMAFDIGYSAKQTSLNVRGDTKLQIIRNLTNKINKETIKNNVKDVILKFFDPSNNKLGQTLDLSKLASEILSIEGVERIQTNHKNEIFKGISFISWNPIYQDSDISFITQTTTLPFYTFPYFYSPESLISKIDILNE